MHARGQDRIGEQARQIGAAAAAAVAGGAASAGWYDPRPRRRRRTRPRPRLPLAAAAAAAVAAAAHAAAAIGKFRAGSGVNASAVAPVPGGAGGDTRAAAAVKVGISPPSAAGPVRAARPAEGPSARSAAGPGLSGTTVGPIARPASAASDSKDTGSEKDEAAAAAATPPKNRPAFCPCPPTKSVRVSPAVRTMSPETSAPRPPTALMLAPPLAPRTSSAYSPVVGTVKENIPGVMKGGSAFASATEASIARAETPEQHRPRLDHALPP